MELYDSEEQQVEAIKDWWKENGKAVIFGAVIGLGGLFGWRYYQDSVVEAREAASESYTSVISALDTKGVDAQSDIQAFIDANKDAEYSVLAAMQLAKAQVQAGDLAAALEQLEWAKSATKDAALTPLLTYRAARIKAEQGEAGFAASGSNVQMINDSTYVFVSGGLKSRFFRSNNRGENWNEVLIPYYPGEASGAFSVCFANDSIGVITGGDYVQYNLQLNTTYFTTDGGKSWFNSEHPPRGYRACVFETNGVFYACGRNGIDFSTDGGVNWTAFADGTYYCLDASETQLYATSKEGKVFKFDLIKPKHR